MHYFIAANNPAYPDARQYWNQDNHEWVARAYHIDGTTCCTRYEDVLYAGSSLANTPARHTDGEGAAYVMPAFVRGRGDKMNNGAVVLDFRKMKSAAGLKPAEIVLAWLPHNTVTPFATWQVNTDDGGAYWGDYYLNAAEAEAGFRARCEKKGVW